MSFLTLYISLILLFSKSLHDGKGLVLKSSTFSACCVSTRLTQKVLPTMKLNLLNSSLSTGTEYSVRNQFPEGKDTHFHSDIFFHSETIQLNVTFA